MRKDVREVIRLCESLGLVVDPIGGSGTRTVRDPKSGAYVFGISSSPSDPNWQWMIMRHLRRIGALKQGTQKKGRWNKKAAIDLTALAKAQAQAESQGERIPMLEDLDDDRTFLSRITRTSSQRESEYSDEAMEEVIDSMAPRADAPRIDRKSVV